jgi:hypothetical protein
VSGPRTLQVGPCPGFASSSLGEGGGGCCSLTRLCCLTSHAGLCSDGIDRYRHEYLGLGCGQEVRAAGASCGLFFPLHLMCMHVCELCELCELCGCVCVCGCQVLTSTAAAACQQPPQHRTFFFAVQVSFDL